MSHDHTGHSHSHGMGRDADRRYLTIALVLLSAFLILEVIAAILTSSLALLSDAGHMLSDVAAIALSLWALRLAQRPAQGAWTFGWKRAEILSAAANGITLLVVGGVILVEAIRRLVHPPAVEGGPVIAVAVVGLAVNVAAAWMLAKAGRQSLNVEGAYQHILTDAYGFIATIVAGIVVLTTGFDQADSIASLVVVGLMLHAAVGLLRSSGRILLEAAPEGIDLEMVRAHVLRVEHVRGIHDLHAWTVTSDLVAISAHVVVDDECFHDGHTTSLLPQLQSCLGDHFDLAHSTVQFEPASHSAHEHAAHN